MLCQMLSFGWQKILLIFFFLLNVIITSCKSTNTLRAQYLCIRFAEYGILLDWLPSIPNWIVRLSKLIEENGPCKSHTINLQCLKLSAWQVNKCLCQIKFDRNLLQEKSYLDNASGQTQSGRKNCTSWHVTKLGRKALLINIMAWM